MTGHQSATSHSFQTADLAHAVDRTLLGFYSPAVLVITNRFRVLEIRGDVQRFGFPSSLTRVPRGPLGTAIRHLIATQSPAEETVEGTLIKVLPVDFPDASHNLFCVLLQLSDQTAADRVHELEGRLAAARDYLGTVLDEYGSTTEELRSAYEELKTANEELHRLNDELAAANQDLTSINSRLESRTRELQRVNAELGNVLSSVGIPMVLLDMDLHLRRFTPQAARLFRVSAADIGSPMAGAWMRAGVPDLEEICRGVLDTFTSYSRPITLANGRPFSLVARPYRTADNQIAGVIVALVDRELAYSSPPSV